MAPPTGTAALTTVIARAQPDKPTVGDHRGRMDEAGGKGDGDDAQVNNEKGCVAIDPGKENVADARHQRRRQHDRPGAEAIDEIADDGRCERAFGAGQ